MYQDTRLFIDGAWCDASDGQTLPVLNPATEERIGEVSRASPTDLDRALVSVAGGFRVWKETPAFDRSALMRKAAAILRERSEFVAGLMTLEEGKPLAEARAEVLAGAHIIDWFAEEARRAYGHLVPARMPNVNQTILFEPIGPVAAFTPWNFPVNQAVRKIAIALAAGCSILIKGPEETPASCAELVRAFADAGLPPGVVNLVYGDPSEISSTLIPHDTIRKVSFTGSTAVGKQLAAMAGLHMKRVTMELGGHAPVIICNDADIESSVWFLIGSKFRNAGQACVAPTRFLIQDGVYDRFLDRFLAATREIRVGPGMDATTTMGPVANQRRLKAMEALVADAIDRGATLLLGGKRQGNRGYFFEPTILADVPQTARLMREEPFGPVALMRKFHAIDEAITEANRLPYGLAAYLCTRSADTIALVQRGVECGMISVNHYGIALPEVHFGGVRDSGYGSEGGHDALKDYMTPKLLSVLTQ